MSARDRSPTWRRLANIERISSMSPLSPTSAAFMVGGLYDRYLDALRRDFV
jgi:hypothetical protein